MLFFLKRYNFYTSLYLFFYSFLQDALVEHDLAYGIAYGSTKNAIGQVY